MYPVTLLLYVNYQANFKSFLSSSSSSPQFGDTSYLPARLKVQHLPNNFEFVLAL
jgi:hypothetical protein